MSKFNQALTTNTTTLKSTQQKRKFKKCYGLIAAISAVIALVWIISPVDPIPDILVGLGQLDDILVACIPVVTSCLALKQHIDAARNS